MRWIAIAALVWQGSTAFAVTPSAIASAKIIGPDGRARTSTQHEYWIARHPDQRARLVRECQSKRNEPIPAAAEKIIAPLSAKSTSQSDRAE
jgi:hypothetical protein